MNEQSINYDCMHTSCWGKQVIRQGLKGPNFYFYPLPPCLSNHFPSFGLILHKMESVSFACLSALLSQSRITHIKEPFKTTKLHECKLIFKTRNTWSYNFPPAGRRQFIQRQKVCVSSTVLPSTEGDQFHSQFSCKNLNQAPSPRPATGHLDAQNLRLIPPGLWGRGVLLSSFLYDCLKIQVSVSSL